MLTTCRSRAVQSRRLLARRRSPRRRLFAPLSRVLPSSPVPVSARPIPRSTDKHANISSPAVGPVRNYAAEAGGKFERKLPHMNIG